MNKPSISVYSDAWSNFKEYLFNELYADHTQLSYNKINMALDQYCGAIAVGAVDIEFETEQDLSFFLLRWS